MTKFMLCLSALIFLGLSVGVMKIQAADEKFVYAWNPPGRIPDIYVAEGDRDKPKRLTDDLAWDRGPAWSPDGNRIAFVSDRILVVMNADGKNRQQIVVGADWRPAWSPDGRQLAVMAGKLSIWIFDVETGKGRRIPETGVGMLPTWSPDGLQIAFRSDLDQERNWDIYRIDIDGKNLQRLTTHRANDLYPAWAPDGRQLAFSSDRDGKSQIYIMDMMKGNEIRQLTASPFSAQGPAWSPEGDRIAFGGRKNNDIESNGIYVVDAEGGQPTLLIPGPSGAPAWWGPPNRFAVHPQEKRPAVWGAIKKSD